MSCLSRSEESFVELQRAPSVLLFLKVVRSSKVVRNQVGLLEARAGHSVTRPTLSTSHEAAECFRGGLVQFGDGDSSLTPRCRVEQKERYPRTRPKVVTLADGAWFVMGGAMQQQYLHGVPGGPCSARGRRVLGLMAACRAPASTSPSASGAWISRRGCRQSRGLSTSKGGVRGRLELKHGPEAQETVIEGHGLADHIVLSAQTLRW